MRKFLLASTILCAATAAHAQTVSLNLNAPVTMTGGPNQLLMGFPYGGGSQQTLPSNGEGEAYELAGIAQNPGGSMTLTASPNPNTSSPWPNNLPYQSGAISTAGLVNGEPTQGGFAATYGTFSMTATLPSCSATSACGLWPAFWLMPLPTASNPNPQQCEIDVMENLGASDTYYATIHFPGSTSADSVPVPIGNTTVTNTYTVDWEPGTITFLLNGNRVAQFPTPASCNGPEYVLANLAVGGQSYAWPGVYSGGPASMTIDSISYDPGANGQILGGSGLVAQGTEAATAPVVAAPLAAIPSAQAAVISPLPDLSVAVSAAVASAAAAPCSGENWSTADMPGGGSVTDGDGNVWSVSPTGEALENGDVPAFSANISALYVVSGTVWHENMSGQFYYWTGSQWLASYTPPSPGQAQASLQTTCGSASAVPSTSGTASVVTTSSGFINPASGAINPASGAINPASGFLPAATH